MSLECFWGTLPWIHPHGLGWQPTEGSHYFSGLSLHMPRAELKKRSIHMEDLKKWYANDKPFLGSMGPGHCKMLCENARALAHEVSAVYDGPMLQLDPFEEAVVPVTWGGGWVKNGPPDECMIVGRDDGIDGYCRHLLRRP